MKEFTYTITNKTGLHTRRAGLLAMHAKAFQDTRITVSSNGNTANTNQLMKLISMGLRQQGDRSSGGPPGKRRH